MIEINNSTIIQGYNQRKFRLISVTSILVVLTICLCAMMLIFGNTKYSLDVIIRVLCGE